MNDATTAADVFSFPSDQLNLLVDAGVISPCAFADVVSSANQEETVTAGTITMSFTLIPKQTITVTILYMTRALFPTSRQASLRIFSQLVRRPANSCYGLRRRFLFLHIRIYCRRAG